MSDNATGTLQSAGSGTRPAHTAMLAVGALMAVVGVAGYLLWLPKGLVREGNWIGIDFHVYYQAGLVLRRGEDIYGAGISPPYVYPPLLAALVAPLSALPVAAATMLWKLWQHVWLVVAGGLLVSMVPARVRPLAAGALLLMLLTVAVQDEIRVGESNSLVLALVVGALRLIARHRERAQEKDSFTPWAIGAGVLLALAVAIKVLPGLLVAYLWWRGPRGTAAVATGVFLALQLLMLALTPSTGRYWLVEFPGLFGQAFPYLDNQSLNALVSRAVLPETDPGMPPMRLLEAEGMRPLITWVLNALVVAATVLVLLRGRRATTTGDPQEGRVRLLLEAGLVLLATHLVSGSTWLHHYVLLAVPVAGLVGAWGLGLARGTTSTRGTLLLWLGLGLALVALLRRPSEWVLSADTIAPGNAGLAFLASNMGVWVVVGLLAAVGRVMRKT